MSNYQDMSFDEAIARERRDYRASGKELKEEKDYCYFPNCKYKKFEHSHKGEFKVIFNTKNIKDKK